MNACEIPAAEMFSKAVHLHLEGKELTFYKAKRAAYERAGTYGSDPMLLSWDERANGSCFPNTVECCERGKPSWVTYAQSRGGGQAIDINDENYIFIFGGQEGSG